MTQSTHDSVRPATALASADRVGGIGGLVFVAAVVAQNAIRASAPAMDSGAAKVITYYAAHRSASAVLAILYVVGAAGIVTFSGGLLARLRAPQVRGAAIAGALGLSGIFGLFTVTVAADLALSGYVHRGAPDPAAVSLLWTLHNAVFGVLLVAIGVALAGLSAAAAGQGLLGARWKAVGLVGAVALGIAGAATPAIIDGSPVMAVGLIGFLTWLAFVGTTSVALLRSAESRT